MQSTRETRWWLSEPEDVANDVCSIVRRIWSDDEPRRTRLDRAARLYGPGLHLGRQHSSGAMLGALSMNVVRALVQTASSTLLQTAPPRPMFLTDGGDFELQEKAKGMTRLAGAVLQKTLFDEQARGDTLISAALGTAVSKVHERDGFPVIERVFPWELLVDERDGYDGKPRSMYQIHWIDRAVLAARYGKSLDDLDDGDELDVVAEAIRRAGTAGLDDAIDRDTTSDQVCVLEAWHLPSSKSAGDGRHVACTDMGVLHDEPWKEESFPFAFLHWGAPLTGFWSPGVADEIWTLQLEINMVLLRIRDIIGRHAVGRTWVERGSKATPAPTTNDKSGIAYYTGRPPIVEAARVASPDLWQYLEYLWGKCFALLGISELSASAMKPAGLDSGKAMRVYADLASGRLNAWSRAWQDYYLAVSRQLVALMRRGKKGRELAYLDSKAKKVERVRWEDVAMDEGEYELQVYAISSLPTSPAGRFAQLDAWLERGAIDITEYREMSEDPDLTAANDLATAPRRAVKAACESMLWGKPLRYVAPSSFDDLKTALTLGNLYLVNARVAGMPEERTALLERYLVEAKALLPPPPAPPPPVDPAAAGMVPPGAGAVPPDAAPVAA